MRTDRSGALVNCLGGTFGTGLETGGKRILVTFKLIRGKVEWGTDTFCIAVKSLDSMTIVVVGDINYLLYSVGDCSI